MGVRLNFSYIYNPVSVCFFLLEWFPSVTFLPPQDPRRWYLKLGLLTHCCIVFFFPIFPSVALLLSNSSPVPRSSFPFVFSSSPVHIFEFEHLPRFFLSLAEDEAGFRPLQWSRPRNRRVNSGNTDRSFYWPHIFQSFMTFSSFFVRNHIFQFTL